MKNLSVALRSRFIAVMTAIGIAATGITIAGCDNGSARNLTAVAENSIEALVLNAGVNQLVDIASDVDPGLGAVVELGVFVLANLDAKVQQAQAAAPDATFLIVQQIINGTTKDTVYRISTQQSLVVALNGQFVETITLHRITVDVVPGTDSTIIVTVKHPKNLVYRSGQFNYSRLPFDLDDGIGGAGQLSKTQVEVNRHWDWAGPGWELVTVNGTEAAPWHGSQLPTLANCASLPTASWNTTMIAEQNWGWIKNGTAWCVHTPTGRYGVVVTDSGGGLKAYFDYLMWKTPSEM